MMFYFFIIFILAILSGIFVSFDLLIRLQYKNYEKSWIVDGKPMGMFFYPKSSSFFYGSSRRNSLMRRWFFQTPSWMFDDIKAKKLLQLYRLSWILFLITFFSPIILYLM